MHHENPDVSFNNSAILEGFLHSLQFPCSPTAFIRLPRNWLVLFLLTVHLEIFHCTHHPVIPNSDLYFTFLLSLPGFLFYLNPSFTKPFGTHTFYQGGGGGGWPDHPCYLKNHCLHELEIL